MIRVFPQICVFQERQIVPSKECPTSPREADRAVSLPLPKATPSLEMFSRETERLSLIEKTGLLAGMKSGNQH